MIKVKSRSTQISRITSAFLYPKFLSFSDQKRSRLCCTGLMLPSMLPLLFVAIPIILPFSSFLIGTVDSQNYLCYDQDGNFTSNETYGTTLDSLLGSITTTTSGTLTYGLFNASASRPQYPDDIQVLGVCSGDVLGDACRNCLNRTAHQVRQLCPTKKQAGLFEDKCWIRYSNRQIYGVVNLEPYILMWNVQNVSNWDQFAVQLKQFMENLGNQAAAGGQVQKYATGNRWVDFVPLYGMAQCSPDLSDRQCSDCIVEIIRRLPQGRVGGMILTPSCRSRFERYPFSNTEPNPLPPPSPPPPPTVMTVPPPASTQTGSDSSKTWIIVGGSSGSAVILICILVFLTAKLLRDRSESKLDNLAKSRPFLFVKLRKMPKSFTRVVCLKSGPLFPFL